MTIKLPEPEYYSLEMLARRWGCSVGEVIHYGGIGMIHLCVLSDGWYLESGYYDSPVDSDDRFTVPDNHYYSFNELLPLYPRTIREIARFGEVKNPDFWASTDKYLWLNPFRYDLEQPNEDTLSPIIIRSNDLFARRLDVKNFEELGANDSQHIVSFDVPVTDTSLKAMVPQLNEWAMVFWDSYFKQNKKTPTKEETAKFLKKTHKLRWTESAIIRELSGRALERLYEEARRG